MIVNADGYSIDFTDAINVFVFDEKDPNKSTFHGQPMKAVDVIAEFHDRDIFLEIKEYLDKGDEIGSQAEKRNWLQDYLKYKYRDSFLYRYAEGKVDKPIHYICLLNFDNALNSHIKKCLKRELPVEKSKRWHKKIVESCQVVNLKKWEENFPNWTITKK